MKEYRITSIKFCGLITTDDDGKVIKNKTAPIFRKFNYLSEVCRYYKWLQVEVREL